MDGATHVVECLWAGVTRADVTRLDRALSGEQGRGSTYLGLTLVPEDEVVFAWFVTVSAEEARARVARAGAPAYRVVAVERATTREETP
jgi:uncharacterized protein YbaA (DUF1428 family)